MNAEIIARLLMVLTGFVLAMLGVITFVHSGDHKILGLLITFGGVLTIFGGLPHYEYTLSRTTMPYL